MLKVRARLSASGGLAQPGPLGEGPVVVALPRHRQPCHELLLRKAVRLRVDACPFLANGLNEVERLLSETAVGLDGEGREGVSLALCKDLVLGSLGVLAHDERVTCHSVNLAFDRGGKGVCARHIHLEGSMAERSAWPHVAGDQGILQEGAERSETGRWQHRLV